MNTVVLIIVVLLWTLLGFHLTLLGFSMVKSYCSYTKTFYSNPKHAGWSNAEPIRTEDKQ